MGQAIQSTPGHGELSLAGCEVATDWQEWMARMGVRRRAAWSFLALALLFPALVYGIHAASAATGKTFYVNGATGNDANSGLIGAPWKSYHQMLAKIGDGTVGPGDTVLVAPGFYRVYDTGGGLAPDLMSTKGSPAGGTAGSPVTISVDTSMAGDVEIDAAAPANLDGNGPLVQAKKCTKGTQLNIICDNDNDCPTGGVNSCAVVPGVWYIDGVASPYESTGKMGGVAFERGANPGTPPKFYQTLYSPPVSPGQPITMPTFTAGKDQFWPYIENPKACVAAHDPWMFCTGAQTGTATRTSGRAYLQTASGAQPLSAYIPVGTTLSWGGDFPTSTSEVDYVTFTNNNNGRHFNFWWGETNVMRFVNAQHDTVEDSTIQYTSAGWARQMSVGTRGAIASGSGFPRDLGGPQYPVLGASGPNDRDNNTTFRRTKIAYSGGDENIHWSHGPRGDAYDGYLTLDHVEDAFSPWVVPNGHTPDAVSVAESWPPAGYTTAPNDFTPYFPSDATGFWSPLGGGGQSPAAFIIQTNFTTVQDSYFHDAGGPSFREQDGPGGVVFERNIVDLAFEKYGAPGGSSHHPTLLVTQCDGTPAGNCGGFDGSPGLSINGMATFAGDKGFAIRDNVFENVYGSTGTDVGGHVSNATFAPTTPNVFENNTILAKGDGLYGAQDAFSFGADGADIGTASMPAIVKNNIWTARHRGHRTARGRRHGGGDAQRVGQQLVGHREHALCLEGHELHDARELEDGHRSGRAHGGPGRSHVHERLDGRPAIVGDVARDRQGRDARGLLGRPARQRASAGRGMGHRGV